MTQTDLRVIKTKDLIRGSFLDCLIEIGFQNMTVKNITEKARINRSTFYKHYTDKYDLRDRYVDEIISEFACNLEVDFIDKKQINLETYYEELKNCLEGFLKRKKEYTILWDANLLERQVFDEMINSGVGKLEDKIYANKEITNEKKQYASLYARLFLTTMMCSVRWWFTQGVEISSSEYTRLMILHMSEGVFPTLKSYKIV